MPEQNNNLTKGLNSDLTPIKQLENTYREAKNFVRLSDKGDYYSFTNEKGTLQYCDLPDTYSVISRIVLESDIIFISVKNNLTASQIGVVNSAGIYTVILDDINNELNLDLDHPIDKEARVLINTNRIIYFVDNKNPPRTIDLNNPPAIGKIDKLSSLVPVSNFPIIDSFQIRDSITPLKCGAYQFLFRYINDKGNITNISIPSALTSIGQNSVSSENQYQGGYTDITANKSIVLNISNIDTDYKKLEIIAVNYISSDNTININSTVQLDINSSTITYEYKGDILYPLIIEDILGTTTNYSTAKCIAQKDGRLIISNLKENSQIESQLQTIANQITLKYNIEKLNVNAYKDGNNNAYKVGYKRGEVYSFGFGVIYKNGAKSLVYHIPAPDSGGIATPANTTTKALGTYISTLLYPTGQNYPLGAIRYHLMPTYTQEPPYGNITGVEPTLTATIDNTINVLGIKPYFTDIAEWNSIKGKIQGIYIVRRRRDKVQNMSIFSQGIANYMMDNFNLNNPDPENETSTITHAGKSFRTYNNNKKVLKKTPFMGGIRLGDYLPFYDFGAGIFVWNGSTSNPGTDALQTTQQPAQQTFIEPTNNFTSARHGSPSSSNNNNGYNSTTQCELYKDLLVFYSPEVQLLPKLESDTFTKIRRVGSATFLDNNTGLTFAHSSYQSEDGTGDGESEVDKYPVYYSSFQMASVVTNYSNSPIEISKNYYVPRNSYTTTEYNVDIDNTKQEEFLFLQTKTNNTYANEEFTYKEFSVRNNYSFNNDTISLNNQIKNIYEVIADNTSQYGSVQGQEYVICKYIPCNQDTTPNLSSYNGTLIYGGDTYITRMSFTNKNPIQSKAFMFKTSNNKWFRPANTNDNSYGREYIDIRSNIEFYVESSKNTDLRHSIEGGNIYYRYRPINDSLVTNPEIVDDIKSYNNQYDFENSLQLFYSKSDITNSSIAHYKTRTIWSDETILGELRDRYRDIRPNNFYDIPFNTGEIWDSIVYNNTLYLHTPKTLWKTFFNAIEQSASTAGQVTLGTGGVFPVSLPPQQVITQQGGYGGTISQWGGCNTPFGYIFPDCLQGKIFILSAGKDGADLEEISTNGLIKYTNDNLSVLDDLYTGYTDNPFKEGSKGLLSVYDYELKRWLLIKQHPTNSFALSFDPITKQFTANHDYRPNVLIARDNRLFGIMNGNTIKLYEHNKGNYGNFYGENFSSSISIVVNEGFNVQKTFDNLILTFDSDSATKIQAYRGTGDTLEVYNDRQHSGVNAILWSNTYGLIPTRSQIKGQFLRNHYNLKIPLNALISDNNAIFDSSDALITSNIDQNKLYRDRIKGNYCIIKLNFSNIDNFKITLNEIKTLFRKYDR